MTKKIKNNKKILEKEIENLWKALCLIRDDFKCQYCGSTFDLQVHHIISRVKKSVKYDLENGITLCKRCHTKISVNPNSRIEFLIWYIKKFGIEKLEDLEKKGREVKQFTMSELENIKNDFIKQYTLKSKKKEDL